MNESPKTSGYWAVFYIAEDPVLEITFIPREDLSIDQVETFFSFDEDLGCYPAEEKGYRCLDTVQDAKQVAEMFMKHSCIPVTYGYR